MVQFLHRSSSRLVQFGWSFAHSTSPILQFRRPPNYTTSPGNPTATTKLMQKTIDPNQGYSQQSIV